MAGAAGETFGVLLSPGFTGGMATTVDMTLLLYGRSIVVQDRADATIHNEQRIAAGPNRSK
jgi:hypothetical protein